MDSGPGGHPRTQIFQLCEGISALHLPMSSDAAVRFKLRHDMEMGRQGTPCCSKPGACTTRKLQSDCAYLHPAAQERSLACDSINSL